MAVLVTGAAGFIGSHTVEKLLGEGLEVIGIDSYDDFYDPRIKHQNLTTARDFDSFTEVRGDLLDAATLDSVADHTDEIIHFAARAGVRPSIDQPELYARVNVLGTIRVLQFAKDRGIDRIIFASSSSVYGNSAKVPFSEHHIVDAPISPYAATKLAGELLCRTFHELHGMSIVVLRLFTVYGPRQRPDLAIHKFARLLRQGAAITFFGDGESRRDYTHILDTLQGIQGARGFLERNSGTFEILNIGESQTVSLRELISLLGEELGVIPNLKLLPSQPGDVYQTFADISKARRLLGYAPSVAFRAGVRDFLDWFRATSDQRT